MSQSFEFVSSDGPGRVEASYRSLIRSHCMKGRNRRSGSRRSLQQARRVVAKSQSAEHPRDQSTVYQNQVVVPDWTNRNTTSKAPFSSDPNLSLDCLGMRLEGECWQVLHEFCTFLNFKNAIYPVGNGMGLDEADIEGAQWLFSDAPFLYSLRFFSSAMLDLTCCRPLTPTTRDYLRRTIVLLMERLSERDACLKGSTVYIVALLALTAVLFGDYIATRIHLAGLHRMVHLSGGQGFLQGHPMLYFKIGCLDLSLYLSTGWKPRYPAGISWASTFRDTTVSSSAFFDSSTLRSHLEPKLAVIFEDLQILTRMVNEQFHQHQRLRTMELQEHVNSIQTRLLQLDGMLDHGLGEIARLAMLAFLLVTFTFPYNKEQLRYLADRFYCSYLKIETPSAELSHFILWFLMIGFMTVFDVEEYQLRSHWVALNGQEMSWKEMRQCLQSIMWIGHIHDISGQRIYSQLAPHKPV
ncbi:hypothetical protein F5884DRAFT_269332 [Xylogone sp. PMI_703]|nr:hypothetical protein F5884DRAFT_269332 [Xylogone sp. PMI_703]